MKRLYLLLGLLVLMIVAARFKSSIRKIIPPLAGEVMNHQTIAQRLGQEIKTRLAELPLDKTDGR
ncbi:MAG TPA: hypothetical protein VFR76_04370 [Verrucomicrobiae bacterium]|nr:hypothetical protein [Verrucomicrobiae bacterium]